MIVASAKRSLRPTNMRLEEMIPDTFNPQHDPAFWCVPQHATQRAKPPTGDIRCISSPRVIKLGYGGIAKSMIEDTLKAAFVATTRSTGVCANGRFTALSDFIRTPWTRACVDPELQAQLQEHCLPVLPATSMSVSIEDDDPEASTSVTTENDNSRSSSSSVTAATWEDVPAETRYLALWWGRIVYSDRRVAKAVFMLAELDGAVPSILSTADYDEAQAFSMGSYWIED
ncbi:hypothetical protein B0H13DRAFT_2353933 [Mycena leptocephala]|nr:hypothetical protein B0H13DRAFT_2353933 [Mycena leptocephala]